MPFVPDRVCMAHSCLVINNGYIANMLDSLDAFDTINNDNGSNGTVQRCSYGSPRAAQRGSHLLRVPGKC